MIEDQDEIKIKQIYKSINERLNLHNHKILNNMDKKDKQMNNKTEQIKDIIKTCSHVNLYDKENPICQRGCGISNVYYPCDGNCDYVKEQLQNKYVQDLQNKLDNLTTKIKHLQETNNLLIEQMDFNLHEMELAISKEIDRGNFLLKEFNKVDKQRDTWREKAEHYEDVIKQIKSYCEIHCKPEMEPTNKSKTQMQSILNIINKKDQWNVGDYV